MIRQRKRLVYGVGVNDADYQVQEYAVINGRQKQIGICPFYSKWKGMLKRCYSQGYQEKQPTYIGCLVCDDWHRFSTFKAWMETQSWQGKQLDKDILVKGNKIYSPETCVFVDSKINNFLMECGAVQGEWPTGVYLNKKTNRFMARCCNLITGKREFLGLFDAAEDAHAAWLTFKLEQAYILASMQFDTRLSNALVSRYENYDTN